MPSMLKGLKDAFAKPALKSASHAMVGGGVASVVHLVAVTKTTVFDSWWKRAALAVGIGTIGAHYAGKKDKTAAAGVQGAMGGVIAIELWSKFAGGVVVKGLSAWGAPMPNAFPPADRPLMSNIAGTQILTGRGPGLSALTLMPGGAGTRLAGTSVLPIRRSAF